MPSNIFIVTDDGIDFPEQTVLEIKKSNPEIILLVKGTEIDVEYIYEKFLGLIEPWLLENNKFLYVFSPALHSDTPVTNRPNVRWNLCPLLDAFNYNNIINYYEQNKPVLSNPTKLFTCYNNQPRDYRDYLIDHMAKFDLLKSGIVTYRLPLEILNKEENYNPLANFSYYNGYPRLVDEEDFLMYTKDYFPNNLPKSYLFGLVDIVTETTVNQGELALTEKTNKPLMAQKPFLVLAPSGYHEWLKQEYKIEPYDEIFDYSFDSLSSFKDRADGIISNLMTLKENYKTSEDYAHLLKILKPKLEHNLNSYLKTVASGTRFLKNINFEWMKLEYNSIIEILSRKENDYKCEFHNLHDFIHRIVLPYNSKSYDILDISR